MPEPVTTGTLIASALGAAAVALAKGTLGEAAKDVYGRLKSAVAHWGGDDVEKLEKNPGSPARKEVVAEAIDETTPEQERENLAALAKKLVAELRAEAQVRGPIGVEIGTLESLEVELGRITAREGIGFKADKVKTETFRLNEIQTGGNEPGKP